MQKLTNITEEHKRWFAAISSPEHTNIALVSCFVDGAPTAAIAVVTEDGPGYKVTPLFVAITSEMILTDHEGVRVEEPEQSTIECLVDSAAGIYTAQAFLTRYDMTLWGVSEEDQKILRGEPNGVGSEHYDETWARVLDTAETTDAEGKKWWLHQDCDLFAVREDHDFEEVE